MKFKNIFKRKKPVVEESKKTYLTNNERFLNSSLLDDPAYRERAETAYNSVIEKNVRRKAVADFVPTKGAGMDSAEECDPATEVRYNALPFDMNVSMLNYFGNQGFIGYQFCAILSQNWLIGNACTIPAEDAVRKGYEVTVNNGDEVDPKVLSAIDEAAVKYKIQENMIEFIRFHNIFGIRIAMFHVDSPDSEYYEKPFNIDGVRPGSYRGISQIDPMWIMPILDQDAVSNAASLRFYEPTFWILQGKKIHHSHLIIIRTKEPPDILKATYYWGGIPLTQELYHRVYSAERTADEAPLLTMTKRLNYMKVNLEDALADQINFNRRIQFAAQTRDNMGVAIVDHADELAQLDTALADVDTVMMTQYQLVSSIARMPVTKLLCTQLKGFNSTGEYEESTYHELLGTLQDKDTLLLNRHLLLLIKSDIAPKFGIAPFPVVVKWHTLDSLTAKEEADIKKVEAETDLIWTDCGAIDGENIKDRIKKDPDSGYNGLTGPAPEKPETDIGGNLFGDD